MIKYDFDFINLETELNNKLFYKKGDTINIYGIAGGYFTTNGKSLSFSVPVSKRLDNIQDAKITSASMTVRQDDFYCIGSAENRETLNLNTDNPNAIIVVDANCLNISFRFPTKRAKINNDACGIYYVMDIVLS